MPESKKKNINPNPPTNKKSSKISQPTKVDPNAEMLRGLKEEVDESKVDFKSKDAVVKAYYSLVQVIAANIVSSGRIPANLSFDDLLSYGISGLVKAWENFDKKKGVKFKVYASYRIRGEILDKIRKEWKYQNPGGYKSVNKYRIDEKVSQAAIDTKGLGGSGEEAVRNVAVNSAVAYLLSFEEAQGDVITDSTQSLDDTVVSQIDFSEEKKALWEAVKTLNEDEKRIIKLFYIEDKTQKEIAEELAYSKSKVSRMHANILNKLRLRLQRRMNYEN